MNIEFLDRLDGQRIPGGCEDCDAYQTVDTTQPPIYRITVHHDDTCPTYQAMQEQQRRTQHQKRRQNRKTR